MKVSVIIPLYNKEHFIQSTIESVLSQTFQDWEIILIDDGSTDNSAIIAQSIHDSRIRFFKQENLGVSITRNRGIKYAKGEYIAFLDADDKWQSNYLAKMVSLTKDYSTYSVFCSAQKGRPVKTLPDGISIIEDHCKYDYIFWTGCMLIKKDVFLNTGGFREGVQLGEDRDMWLRIACKYPTIYLNEELVFHPYETENNLARIIDITKSFPYWEWYDYPYPYHNSLYRYTTNQIVNCTNTLVAQHRYAEAWQFLQKTRGTTALRPRLKLLLKIVRHFITKLP